MDQLNKLLLFKKVMCFFVNELGENDMVLMVVYVGVVGMVLEFMKGIEKIKILIVFDKFDVGGFIVGGEGI